MISLKSFLDEHEARINTPAFIEDDPVQFPRRYSLLQDIEIVAFTVATIAWGKRAMILRDAERMLKKMGDSPYSFVMNGGDASLGHDNVHRTFFEHHLAATLRAFRHIYTHHSTLEDYLKTTIEKPSYSAGWQIAKALQDAHLAANGTVDSRCIPTNCEATALKRIHLALRWLVRNDGIVDLGVWTFLRPAHLCIPLDVHVGNVARRLGLLERKSNDRKAVEALTAALRDYCPEDPVKYDFALFGIGVEGSRILNG